MSVDQEQAAALAAQSQSHPLPPSPLPDQSLPATSLLADSNINTVSSLAPTAVDSVNSNEGVKQQFLESTINSNSNPLASAPTSLPTPPTNEPVFIPTSLAPSMPVPMSDLRSEVEPVSSAVAEAAAPVPLPSTPSAPASLSPAPATADDSTPAPIVANGFTAPSAHDAMDLESSPAPPPSAPATAPGASAMPAPAAPLPIRDTETVSAPVVVPPPPIAPLPTSIEIPAPPSRSDSLNSLAVEPPTPGGLAGGMVPNPLLSSVSGAGAGPAASPSPLAAASSSAAASSAPADVPTPTELPIASTSASPAAFGGEREDSVMGEQAPVHERKRSAPEEEISASAGGTGAGLDEREVKRPKVEELPVLGSSAPLATTPDPVIGYDPTAFSTAPPPPLVPTPSTSALPYTNGTASPATPLTPGGSNPVATSFGLYIPPPSQVAIPEPILSGPVPVFTKAQQKFGLSLVRSLKKHRSVAPFLRPVDPVALHIPDYHKVITRPMDLGTVEAKIHATGKAQTNATKVGRTFGLDYNPGSGEPWEGQADNVYRTAAEFRTDVDLIWDNCFRYNGPKDKNPVSAMAGQMQEAAEKGFRAMPPAPAIEYKPEPPRPPTPEVVAPKERRPSHSFVPTIRRSEDGVRPKREIHAPARELPYEEHQGSSKARGKVSGKMAHEQLKFCKEVMKELFKKTHEAYAFPFYTPVDIVALNIPQYPSIVKNPMDLGTIRTKLDQGLYPVPPFEAFESDVRLVFDNCYAFNPPNTVVHDWGKQLEAVFDAKWDERPAEIEPEPERDPTPEPLPLPPPPPPPLESDDDEDDGILMMERQLQTMQANLEAMKAKKTAEKQKRAAERAAVHAQQQQHYQAAVAAHQAHPSYKPPKASKKPAGEGAARKQSAAGGGGAPKKRASNAGGAAAGGQPKKKRAPKKANGEEGGADEVTFEMKRELAVKIVSFEGPELEKAIDIIRQGRPDLLSDVNKEIELDIDQLDQRTLMNLYRFVCPGALPAPRKNAPKRRNPPAGGGAAKRKNLDEIKESERIEMLEARLREFENGGSTAPGPDRRGSAATPTAADQASSSSESEDGSDSESDED